MTKSEIQSENDADQAVEPEESEIDLEDTPSPAEEADLQEVDLPEEAIEIVQRLQAERDDALAARTRALADYRNFQRRATENENRALAAGASRVARTTLSRDLVASLEEMGEKVLPPIGQRVVVAEAALTGLTVREHASGSLAQAEFQALALAVEEVLRR